MQPWRWRHAGSRQVRVQAAPAPRRPSGRWGMTPAHRRSACREGGRRPVERLYTQANGWRDRGRVPAARVPAGRGAGRVDWLGQPLSRASMGQVRARDGQGGQGRARHRWLQLRTPEALSPGSGAGAPQMWAPAAGRRAAAEGLSHPFIFASRQVGNAALAVAAACHAAPRGEAPARVCPHWGSGGLRTRRCGAGGGQGGK
jgi:hypothetical protein